MTQSIIIDGYQTLSALHIGEHSAVYSLVEQDADKQAKFVVKIARTDLGALRLKREISLLDSFSVHEQILKPITAGTLDSMPYFIVPFCELSLRSFFTEQSGPFQPARALDILRELAKPLSFLHDKGFVHGDISPNNFMLHAENGNESAQKWCLIDFASTVEIGSEHFPEERPKRSGTPGFVSPEQRGGMLQLSAQSDIFGLSAVLLFLLTGRDHQFDEALAACLTQDQAIANEPALAEVLKKGLSTAAKERFSSVTVFINAVSEAIATGESNKQKHDVGEQVRSDNNPLSEGVLTQDFSAQTALSKPLQALKQEIIFQLKTDGHLASLDKQQLATKYSLNDTVEQAELVVQSLIDEAIEYLCESQSNTDSKQYSSNLSSPCAVNYRHFLEWTSSLQAFKDLHGKNMREQQLLQFIEQGEQEGAGRKENLRLCIERHFYISKSATAINKRLLISFLGVLVIFTITQLFLSDLGDDKLIQKDMGSIEASDAAAEPATLAKGGDTLEPQSLTNEQKLKADTSVASSINTANENQASFINTTAPESETSKTLVSADKNRLRYEIKDIKTQQALNFELIKTSELIDSQGNYALYVMTTEVSNALWHVCVNAGKCRSSLSASTSAAGKLLHHPAHPAVNVSWYDIQEDFIPFLNESLQTNFALPTMTQWLSYGYFEDSYSTESKPDWPNSIHCINCTSLANTAFSKTSMPVDSVQPSSKGLYHVYGNAQEWLQDCWQDVKLKRERCDQAPAVGGSWRDDKQTIKQKPFVRLLKTARSTTTGFRLVKRESIN
jgi:serine/threonine protein kinase